ncbi:hypothetical protein GCM10011576_10150 [Micromonospora parathelypteridis]|nr:hypothetical protein GCM10011576_10150 [Micromonospora parathelypteridis]
MVFFAVGLGFGDAVRALPREAACCDRVANGLAVTLGEALALGEAAGELGVRLLAAVVGVRSRAVCPDCPEPEVSCTAPTVPPTARATPTAAVATMPAGEEKMRVRECLAATGPVLSSSEQTGSDRNERSTSEVNVIIVVCPDLHWYV